MFKTLKVIAFVITFTILLSITSPATIAVSVIIAVILSAARWFLKQYGIEHARLEMERAQAVLDAAVERRLRAEDELAQAQNRARAAGWMVATSEDVSPN